jgi:hypothetical protein
MMIEEKDHCLSCGREIEAITCGCCMVELPPPVRLALMVLLNHVEPGWENATALVREWFRQTTDERQPT